MHAAGHVLVAGALRAGRRVVGSPDWPVVSAVALAAVALAELRLFPHWATGDPAIALREALHEDPLRPDRFLVSQRVDAVDMLMALLTTLPLALRRWSLPVTAALVVGAMVLTLTIGQAWTLAGATAQLWVMYLLSARYGRVVAALLGFTVAAFLLWPFGSFQPSKASVVTILMAVFAALALGDAARLRRAAIDQRDASVQAMSDAVQDSAVMRERARIARELHDVVAHHVSMIAVQAETARMTSPGLSDQGQARLRAISATAREAMAEMRRLLGVLRADGNGDDGDDGDGGRGRAPQPGLARLNELLDGARAAGTDVRVAVRGEPRPLPQGVDLTAYRIVQEALTNVRRHAPGAAVDLELAYEAGDGDAGGDGSAGAVTGQLRVVVRDDGPDKPDPGPTGHGLLGMRERVAAVGGRLRTGPGPEGGFVVEAVLPVDRAWR
jgi:signal transduction histidine kinase